MLNKADDAFKMASSGSSRLKMPRSRWQQSTLLGVRVRNDRFIQE
jgi:hypothetical protein